MTDPVRRITFAGKYLLAGASLALTGVCFVPAWAAEVLYAHSGDMLSDGRFGPLGRFQAALNDVLTSCKGPAAAIGADGIYGAATVKAIKAFTTCPSAASLSASDPAHDGRISDTLWQLLLPGVALPSLDARVQTLVLTYEATDYTHAEWNFCQNKPFFDPAKTGSECHSNDPRSYLTWGPRGATAGHGREVQAILWLVSQTDRPTVTDAFGEDVAAVDRLITLAPQAVERLLCSVWMNPKRRASWTEAFAKLGASAGTRAAYDDYYRSTRSDGAKMLTFFRLYELAGLTASEVDYGFFVDRATETSPPGSDQVPALAKELKDAVAGDSRPNAHARLFLSRRLIPSNPDLRSDRTGRDLAFVLDALGDTKDITPEEKEKWRARGRFRASDVGLVDERTVGTFTPSVLNLTGMPQASSTQLSDAEQVGCPQPVLHPASP